MRLTPDPSYAEVNHAPGNLKPGTNTPGGRQREPVPPTHPAAHPCNHAHEEIMSDTIMRPLITLHGTAAASMVEARIEAREAARQLMVALGHTAPNRRDYDGDPDAFKRDYTIYRDRLMPLDALYNSLGDEALDIQTRAAPPATVREGERHAP
jgi:hypothetical protein